MRQNVDRRQLFFAVALAGAALSGCSSSTPAAKLSPRIAYAPKTQLLAGSSPTKCGVWDTSGRLLWASSDAASPLAWHPEGTQLLLSGPSAQLQIVDAMSGETSTLDGHVEGETEPTILSAAFSPNGKTVVAAQASRVLMWSLESPTDPLVFAALEGISAVEFSDLTRVILGGRREPAQFWQALARSKLGSAGEDTTGVVSITLNATRQHLTVASTHQITVLTTAKRATVGTLQTSASWAAASPDGAQVAICEAGSKDIKLWQVGTTDITKLSGDQDVHQVVYVGEDALVSISEEGLRKWDLKTGTSTTPYQFS